MAATSRSSRDVFPTAELAVRILESVISAGPWTVRRFPTGTAHFVFDAETADGRRLIDRGDADDRTAAAENAVRLAHLLRPLGIPLPAVIHADFRTATVPFPFVILERLPGVDLGDVYLELTQTQKRSIAAEMVRIGAIVDQLPAGGGFGFAATPGDPSLKRTWRAVLDALIARAESRFAEIDADLFALAERVRAAIGAHSDALSRIEPRPFLHDTTTKNVIVHKGIVSGIVDVDDFCFGDRLFTPALTWASIIARGGPADYVERFWGEARRSRWNAATTIAALRCAVLHRFARRVGTHVRRQTDRRGFRHTCSAVEQRGGPAGLELTLPKQRYRHPCRFQNNHCFSSRSGVESSGIRQAMRIECYARSSASQASAHENLPRLSAGIARR